MTITSTRAPTRRKGMDFLSMALSAFIAASVMPAAAGAGVGQVWDVARGDAFAATLSARIIGIDSRTVACRNVGTGQTVTGSLPDVALNETLDCDSLGLTYAPDDFVILQIEGVNFAGPALNGEASGLQEGALVTCTNRATEQAVTVRVLEGVWDCLNGGIELEPTDPVLIRIQGLASGANEPPGPEAVSLTLTGMDTRTVICRNNSDPQDVSGSLPDVALEETIDCLALGLLVAAGDEIAIQGSGRNFGQNLTASFVGIASGIAARCENRTTGQIVSFALADGETTFDCVTQGLTLTTQDDVTVTLRGNAP